MLPHPTLATRYASPEAKPAFVNALFERGAKNYDAVVNWGFLGSGASYRRRTLKKHGLRPGDHLFDVACGTGLVAVEAATILGTAENITCLDPSAGMLAIARTKLAARFITGRAEALPMAEHSFDFLTMGYALRHVTNLEDTFREFHRVLRPGGKLLILEVTKPAGRFPGLLFRLWFGRLYPWLTRLLTRSADAADMMLYYWETMDACVPPATVLRALQSAGFAIVRRDVVVRLFSEYTAIKPAAPAHERLRRPQLPWSNARRPGERMPRLHSKA